MISQKENSTGYKMIPIGQQEDYATVLERNDILDAMSYVSQSNMNKSYMASWESSSNYLNREINYLQDMVRHLSFELCELRNIIKDKGIVFDESCDEKYAENWRET